MGPSTFANSPAHRPNHTQSAAAGPHEERYDDNDYDCEEGDDYEGEDDGDDDVFDFSFSLGRLYVRLSGRIFCNGNCNNPNSTALIVSTQL